MSWRAGPRAAKDSAPYSWLPTQFSASLWKWSSATAASNAPSRMLKRKLASEGVLRELKMRRHYMKPSIKRRKKQAEAARRRRKRAKIEQTPPVNSKP